MSTMQTNPAKQKFAIALMALACFMATASTAHAFQVKNCESWYVGVAASKAGVSVGHASLAPNQNATFNAWGFGSIHMGVYDQYGRQITARHGIKSNGQYHIYQNRIHDGGACYNTAVPNPGIRKPNGCIKLGVLQFCF